MSVGESRGRPGSRGKLPKFSNFHPSIPLNSVRKAPLAFRPRRKPELCAAPEPERPHAVRAISKVGGSQAGESAGAGRKGAAVSPGEAGAWPGRPAGGRAGERAGSLAGGRAGGGPSAPPAEQLSNRKQVPQRPPARPAPARSLRPLRWSPRPSRPAHRPTGRPGLPPRSRLPWREGSAEPGEPRAQRRSPQPLARTPPPPPRAGRAQGHPTPGRLGKARTTAPRRRRTSPCRAKQPRPAPVPARPPAASAPDSGAVAVAVAVAATALPSRRGGTGSQAPIAARRALTHTHTGAGWPRLGIPGRTDPFPPFSLPPPNFHVFITGLGHY